MVRVEFDVRMRGAPVDRALIGKVVRAALVGAGRAVTVEVAVVDDAEIARTNSSVFGRRAPTDVIAFDLGSPVPGAPAIFSLMVSGETALREGAVRRHSAATELALYVLHGVLHQSGFDDLTPGGRKKMRAAEKRIMNECQIVFGG